MNGINIFNPVEIEKEYYCEKEIEIRRAFVEIIPHFCLTNIFDK